MRTIELLAPAKNFDCGKAAIDCGADAVYIGAQRFGARAAAGNSLDDIRRLCDYAHRFCAKVYVTVNTLLKPEEHDEVRRMLCSLGEMGVDAILVQDMAVVEMARHWRSLGKAVPTLHASTQTDNRDAEKVMRLAEMGFARVVLARELSVQEISDIHRRVPQVELEAFVHGALCVSYSGACYASEYCFHRSANRGECAQFCRLKFHLVDADDRSWGERYWLSLKDMCRIDSLEELMDAGATSLKIEGRLKDEDYVRNVVAAYRQRLDAIIKRRPNDYQRSSWGHSAIPFTPDVRKTFNRGYTEYFLHGRTADIASPDTPKAIGEYVGKVKEVRGHSLTVAGTAVFVNGDGLCFFATDADGQRRLVGFRINRAEGNRLFPFQMPSLLQPGTALYRNADQAFATLLARSAVVRKIPVTMSFSLTGEGFALEMTVDERVGDDADRNLLPPSVRVETLFAHQQAQKPQRDNIVRQLTKLGSTVYECIAVTVADDAANCFIPTSILADMRRQAVILLLEASGKKQEASGTKQEASGKKQEASGTRQEASGKKQEVTTFSTFGVPLMQCRHCLRFAMGYCVRHGGRQAPWHEPLTLVLGDGRRFSLQFDCQHCQMNIYAQV